MSSRAPLAGVRVVESSMLGPAELGGLLADLGAQVIKVEPPQGDYGRQMTWPIVKSMTGEGENSLLSLHINRGKRSIAIDLRKPEGVEIYLDLVQGRRRRHRGHASRIAGQAGAVLREAAGGQPPDRVLLASPATGRPGPTRTCRATASSTTPGPARCRSSIDENGYTYMPEHTSIGIHAGPLYAGLAILAAVIEARSTGHGLVPRRGPVGLGGLLRLVPHRDVEGILAPRRRGVRQQGGQLRAPGPRHRRHAGGRPLPDLRHRRRPRAVHGQRAGLLEELHRWDRPQRPLREVAGQQVRRSRPEQQGAAGHPDRRSSSPRRRRSGSSSATTYNTPIGPVNTTKSIVDDPQFQYRMPWIPKERLDADMLPLPGALRRRRCW